MTFINNEYEIQTANGSVIYTCHPELIEEICEVMHPIELHYINPYEHKIDSIDYMPELMRKYPKTAFVNEDIFDENLDNATEMQNYHFDHLYLNLSNSCPRGLNVDVLHATIYSDDEIEFNGKIKTLMIEDGSTDEINIVIDVNANDGIDKIIMNTKTPIKLNCNIRSSNLGDLNKKLKIKSYNKDSEIDVQLNTIALKSLKSNIPFRFHVPGNDITFMKELKGANFVDQSDIIVSPRLKYIELNSICSICLIKYDGDEESNIDSKSEGFKYEVSRSKNSKSSQASSPNTKQLVRKSPFGGQSFKKRYVINRPDIFNALEDKLTAIEAIEKYEEITKTNINPNAYFYFVNFDEMDDDIMLSDKIINHKQNWDITALTMTDCVIYKPIIVSAKCCSVRLINCTLYAPVYISTIKTLYSIENCTKRINGEAVRFILFD